LAQTECSSVEGVIGQSAPIESGSSSRECVALSDSASVSEKHDTKLEVVRSETQSIATVTTNGDEVKVTQDDVKCTSTPVVTESSDTTSHSTSVVTTVGVSLKSEDVEVDVKLRVDKEDHVRTSLIKLEAGLADVGVVN